MGLGGLQELVMDREAWRVRLMGSQSMPQLSDWTDWTQEPNLRALASEVNFRNPPVRLRFWSWLACPVDGREVSGELIIPAMLHSVTAKISMWNELEWNSGGRRCANWCSESAFETYLWKINGCKVSSIGWVVEGRKLQCHTPFPILNQSIVPCLDLTVASWPAYKFLREQVRLSSIPISLRISHSLLWSTQSKALV